MKTILNIIYRYDRAVLYLIGYSIECFNYCIESSIAFNMCDILLLLKFE